MRLFHPWPFLFAILAALVAGPVCAKPPEHSFHPITEKEKKQFYPLVCQGPAPADAGFERRCDPRLVGSPAADEAPSYLTFKSIAYGSFSSPKAIEVLILFNSDGIGGEGNNGFGAILFKLQKGKWAFSNTVAESMYSECVVIPDFQPERLLCLDHPMICCGQSEREVKEFSWSDLLPPTHDSPPTNIRTLLRSHSGAMEAEYEEPFCAVGSRGETMLTMISNLKPSAEPGVLAEADIDYAVPTEINRICQKRPFNAGIGGQNPDPEPELRHDRVRFVVGGDNVKVLLPKGIKAFAVY